MTPVTELRQRNACRNCQQLGCRTEQCLNPNVLPGICKNCQQQDHKSSQYLSERTSTEPFAIVQSKDIKKQDHPKIVYNKCQKVGHSSFKCYKPVQQISKKGKEVPLHVARCCVRDWGDRSTCAYPIHLEVIVGLARSFPCLFFASFYAYTHMLASSSLLLALVHAYHDC